MAFYKKPSLKQDLNEILKMKGVPYHERRQRIDSLIEKQKEIKQEMKTKKKSPEEIKKKQDEMIRELWER